jgi:hypothetical protein
VVVEQGDDVGDLRRRRAMSEHALDQLADLTAQADQLFDALGAANRPGQVYQVDPLQGKQIALGDHATQTLILDQTDVGDMPFGHGNCRIERTVIRRQVEGRGCHVALDRFVEITDTGGYYMA